MHTSLKFNTRYRMTWSRWCTCSVSLPRGVFLGGTFIQIAIKNLALWKRWRQRSLAENYLAECHHSSVPCLIISDHLILKHHPITISWPVCCTKWSIKKILFLISNLTGPNISPASPWKSAIVFQNLKIRFKPSQWETWFKTIILIKLKVFPW